MSCIKFLWWTVFLHTSFESHHPNVTARREAQVIYKCHLQHEPCVWRDENNYTYNLTLLNKWFRRKGSKYDGTWYFGYNPCKWHWRGGECNKTNMAAICRWPTVGNKSDEFRSIGNGNPRCTIRHDGVHLKYKISHGEYRSRSSTVILKCDEDKVHQNDAKFLVTNEDSNWRFELYHKHACGIPPDIPGGGNLAGYVAVSVVFGCLFLVFAGCLVRGKYNTNNNTNNNNNGNNEGDDDDERRPLPDHETMIYNTFGEPNLESRSRPVPIPNIRNKNQATFA